MMKKIYLTVISLAFLLASCNKWLDINPELEIRNDDMYSMEQGFMDVLTGAYIRMATPSLYGCNTTVRLPELMANHWSVASTSTGTVEDYVTRFDFTQSSTKSLLETIWLQYYQVIVNLNALLAEIEDKKDLFTDGNYELIKGEALGLRAFLHFEVYRMFSPDVKRAPKSDGIPYNKEFGVSLPPMYSAEETIQLIINDLKEAEQCLQNDPIEDVVPYEIRTTTDQGEVIDAAAKDAADQYIARINLYSVKALLARAYQARGENDLAIQKAQEVIDCGKFRLLEFSSIDQSEALTDLTFSDEHIFSLRNSEIDTYAEKLFQDIVSSNGAITQTALPFSNASTLYQGNNDDVRYSKWFNQGNFVKFIPDSTNVYPQKMPVIKLSEMYLLITECSYNTDPDKALEYLNTLRDHRIRGNVHWTYLTKDYIYEEMRREYVGEGQMWYVYKRNNLTIPGGLTGTIEPTEDMFIFPLPDAEIEDGHRTQR